MSVFVARTREIRHLKRRLGEAAAGNGRVIFLTGDAGAGKSTLADRFFLEATLHTPELLIVSGTCSEQFGSGEPYQPFVETFRDLVAGDGEASGRSLRKVAREVAPYWLETIPVAGDLIAATMATAVELRKSFGDTAATRAPPSAEALFFQYTEMLLATAEERPVLLFLDDLHWADRATVSLLTHLARKIPDRRVLILGTYRDADVAVSGHPIREACLELERYGVAETLELDPMDTEALAEFIEVTLGAPPTPELVDWLEERAGTNPLFFGELLRWLVDQEFAAERYGEWILLRTPEELEVPRTAESAIERRLSRLEPEVYRVLEYASVEGDEFDSVLLSRLLDMDELELEERLEPVMKIHKLIREVEIRELPNGEPTSLYAFTHTLFQDVLHANLQAKRRILLHRKVAEILLELYGPEGEGAAHRLAYHFDEGRLRGRAFEFAVRAAAAAGRVYAHRDAIELLERALKNCEADEHRLDVLQRLGEENRLAGQYSHAMDCLDDALELAERLEDARRALSVKRGMVRVDREFGSRPVPELVRQLHDLAEAAREVGDRAELCEILWLLRDLPVPARAEQEEALLTAVGLGDPELQARAHLELGYSLAMSADPEAAIPHLGEALELYRSADARDRAGLCHNALAVAHIVLGSYEAAAAELDQAGEIFDDLGDPVSEASVRNNLGALLVRTGDWERAERNLQLAFRLSRRLDATSRLVHPVQNLAELYSAQGDPARSREHWERLLEIGRETGFWNCEVIAHCGIGLECLAEGDLKAARGRERSAAEILAAQEEKDRWSEAREWSHLLMARLAAAGGDTEVALRTLEAAEEKLASRDRYRWAYFRLQHGRILGPQDPERAFHTLQDALNVFEEMGARPLAEQTRLELEKLTTGRTAS